MIRTLGFFVSVLALVLSPSTAPAADNAGVAAAMAAAADGFLKSLDPGQRTKATMSFDDPARMDWHNIPKPQRKGLQVRDMNAAQREAAHKLLQAALSAEGYVKAVKIMALENNLREGEKGLQGSPLRDPDRYFLTIFGTPSDKGAWGWSFEGHHFSLNFTIRDGKIVGDTPSFWGANPATVHIFIEGGPKEGTRTLSAEEQLAFDLVHMLTADQRKTALIAAEAPADYRAAGVPQPPQTAPEGLAAAKMTPEEKEKLRALLVAYCGNLAEPLAAERIAAIDAADFDRIHFAWAGGTEPGQPHYYRVQGPTFVLELVNIQADPAGNVANHIHSVWRNIQGDFGVPVK